MTADARWRGRRALTLSVGLAALALAGGAQASTKPYVDATTPTSGATNVDPGVSPTAHVVFLDGSAGIDPSTLNASDVLVQPVDPVTKALGDPVPMTASVDGSGATITVDPTSCLALSTKYKVTLLGGTSGIRELAPSGGTAQSLTKKVWSFKTGASSGSCGGGASPLTTTNDDWDANWNGTPIRALVDTQLTMSRAQKWPMIKYPNEQFHQTAPFHINNPSGSPVTVNSLTTSDTSRFVVDSAPQTPFTIPAGGSSGEIVVRFVATCCNQSSGTLTIASDHGNSSIHLDGYWQSVTEHGQEPTPNKIAKIFGFGTNVIFQGEWFSQAHPFDQHGLVTPDGEEVLSPYWVQANSALPIKVRQIAAFHSQGQGGNIQWWTQAAGPGAGQNLGSLPGGGTSLSENWAQSVLPFDGSGRPIEGTIGVAPGTPFGLNSGAEKSDDTLNLWGPDRNAGCPAPASGNTGASVCGHHMRFWPIRDRNGVLVPNVYMMSMDFSGVNYDYNDNVYLITNITPARGDNPGAGHSIRIDTGLASGMTTTDAAGNVWTSDAGLFSPTSAPIEPGDVTTPYSFLFGPADVPLWSTYRGRVGTGNPFTYTIPVNVPSGQKVDVRLLLMERYSGNNAAGDRVFSITANGRQYSAAMDPFAQSGGQNHALLVGLSEVPITNGQLVLRFVASADNPEVNGIEVRCPTATC